MQRKPSLSKERVQILRDGHAEALQKVRQLQDLLTHLRYEGKASLGKNLSQIKQILQFFNLEIYEHMAEEEKIIFPFLRAHLPKLETLIFLLCSEHEDFRTNLKRFEFLLARVVKKRRGDGPVMEKLRDTASYLACLLQSHHQEESEVLFKVADRELRRGEKKELARQIECGKSKGGVKWAVR